MVCNHQYELGAEIAQCIICGYIKGQPVDCDKCKWWGNGCNYIGNTDDCSQFVEKVDIVSLNKEDTDWETKYNDLLTEHHKFGDKMMEEYRELEETNMTMLKLKDDHIHKLNIIQTYLREFLVRQIQEAR